MARRRIGIIMNGVTGRMGLNQHLVRSIVAIRQQGGVALPGGERLLPDPILATRARGTYVVRREHQRGPGGGGIVAGH